MSPPSSSPPRLRRHRKLGGDSGELGFFVSIHPHSCDRPAISRFPTLTGRTTNHRFSTCRDTSVRGFPSGCFAALELLLTRRATLAFVSQPNKITVAKGETIEFVNNKVPHNVVFDEDNVPAVSTSAISHEDYLKRPGEKVTNKFDTPAPTATTASPTRALA